LTFVQTLLKHTASYESPTSFWKWSAYACIAAVLRDNVWLEDGDSKLYPNVYIIFLAASAQRKGRPVTLAEHLIYLVDNVKVISGRSSIQAILQEIGHTETDEKGKIKPSGSAIFLAPELAAGIVSDDQSIQILTDIYDYKSVGHTTNLIGRGKFKVDKLIFSMFGASNEELLKSIYTTKAIYGGLLGRTFLIKPDEFRKSNAFPEGNEVGFRELVNGLKEISELLGKATFTWEAREFYRVWYTEFREEAKKKDDRAGIFGRFHTNVKKLSTILAANELKLEIEKRHVEEAIEEGLKLIKNYNSFILSSGKSTIAEAGGTVLEILAASNGHLVDRRSIIRDHWMNFDPDTLDKVIVAFETAGLIQIQVSGTMVYYKLSEKGEETIGKKGAGA